MSLTSRWWLRASVIEGAPPHLVLVGLPGSGKTTVGRGVAARLGRPFLDFDEEIERRAGCSVGDIFALDGESHFRQLELALARELAEARGMVLSPGGGWAAIPGAIAVLRPPALIIYLRLRPETALRRVSLAGRRRPLLEVPDPLSAVRGMLEAREPFYGLADRVVDVELISLQGVIAQVASLAEEAGGG
jgi:shikimate kinase